MADRRLPDLYFLGSGKLLSLEARRFWMELSGSKEAAMSMQDMEGYNELMDKLLDALPAEQVPRGGGRAAAAPPSQRSLKHGVAAAW